MKRILSIILSGIALSLLLSSCGYDQSQSVFTTSSEPMSNVSSPGSEAASNVRVPWDYRIVQGTVGDLVGSDMTILPDNVLLPNDNNFATGDAVWTLQFMDAQITTDAKERSQISLSSWITLKSYKDEQSAKKDIAELKESITTEVDLVGVYKTENEGQTRQFAVITMPSGNAVKQPVSAEKYAALKSAKKANVNIEQVHDFENYDTVYAKFRGWAK
ncbi:hypothetical protein [Cohnella thailandensis]|uniref:Signal peptide protein n=1 Tax=Cohnella thailandensis TaxID=557557 RepID=A0A841T0A1_9BACL|nr:hypothetical protein [Cohnella thailandensis]MBB6634471.1 signal peptide protein [Cohnella thailandensis]MBP1972975.1 hypothetical protein [Cohnella thailandensis]